MQIKPEHIAQKRRVGTLKGQPVIQLTLKGGLVLLTTLKDGKPHTLAAGPHVAVSRFMAEKAEPDIQLNELSKSEQISEAGYLTIRDNWNKMLAKLPE
jgi:hypothetical protein